jgi:hypothetical protein
MFRVLFFSLANLSRMWKFVASFVENKHRMCWKAFWKHHFRTNQKCQTGKLLLRSLHRNPSEIIMSPFRTKGDILFQYDFFFFGRFRFFFRFFSAKLVRTITFLSFQIGQWYLVCGCMTIRRRVTYRNDLRGTLTFDLKVK